MVTEVKASNVVSVSDHQSLGAGVQAVQPAKEVEKAQQELPVEGKKLPPETKNTEVDSEALEDAVRDMNEHVQQANRELQFSVDKNSGRTVITVLDKETQQVVRQIPGDEALHFAQRLEEGADLKIFSAVT